MHTLTSYNNMFCALLCLLGGGITHYYPITYTIQSVTAHRWAAALSLYIHYSDGASDNHFAIQKRQKYKY